jgi:hypothetical protein
MENNKLNNLDFSLVNEEEKDLLSVINANIILGNNYEKEFEAVVQIDEVNLDNRSVRSEKSTMSRDDVAGLISENNQIIKMDMNDLRCDMMEMNNNIKSELKCEMSEMKSSIINISSNINIMNNRFDSMSERFEKMFDNMMLRLSITSMQKVSDDQPMSDHIGGFIKDPNLIESNVKQLIDETVQSTVGESAGKVKVFEEYYQQQTRVRDSTMIEAREITRMYSSDK